MVYTREASLPQMHPGAHVPADTLPADTLLTCCLLPPPPAVVYTREAHLPKEYIPELKLAAESVGLDWDKFVVTNNSCGPHPPQKSLVAEVCCAAGRPCFV